MKDYIKYRKGIRIDMMGNYHDGCKKQCCRNMWGFPTDKGINNNCKIVDQYSGKTRTGGLLR